MEKTKTSGKVTFQDKSVYIGELENEIPNGYGVWTHPNGEEYKGQWADGKKMVQEFILIPMVENSQETLLMG